MRDDSPWDGEGFRLKNIRIRRTVSRKIACIVGMYTNDPSGQFYSLQYVRLISDRMSYRNHYMRSGEATSVDYNNKSLKSAFYSVVRIKFPHVHIK